MGMSLHRGSSLEFPENTIASFSRAIQLGASIELDVRETKDHQYVVFHDATLSRTTNGNGDVSNHTLAQLSILDAGAWFGKQFAGERIPTLQQVLDLLHQARVNAIMVEIKAADPQQLVDYLHNNWSGELVLFAKSKDHFKSLKKIAPENLVERPKCAKHFSSYEHCLHDSSARIIKINVAEFSIDYVNAARAHDIKVMLSFAGVNISSVNPKTIRELVRADLQYVVTDQPEHVQFFRSCLFC